MIGLLGGTGSIGSKALEILSKVLPNETIKVGSRNINSNSIPSGINNAICKNVDIFSQDTLEEFFNGCSIVINCSGSSYKSTPLLIDMAIKKQTHLVDVGLCNVDTCKYTNTNNAIVYCSGSVPGVSGMLPLVQSKGFSKVENIVSIYEIKGVFSHIASKDYLNGIMHGNNNDVMYIYKDRNSFFNSNRAFNKIVLPKLFNAVKLFPYYDDETKYVADFTQCNHSEWYSATSGKNMLEFFEKLPSKYKNSIENTIDELVEVSKQDVLDDRKYVQYLVQLDGLDNDGKPKAVTTALTVESQQYLTGAVAVAQALSIYNGNIDSGVYPIYCSKYVEDIWHNLESLNVFEDYSVYSSHICDIQEECLI